MLRAISSWKVLCILSTCAMFFLIFSANASAGDIEELLKEYIVQNYPWPEIDIENLTIKGNLNGHIPQKITIEKGPPGRTVFLLELNDGRKIEATANVKAYDLVVMSRRPQTKGYTMKGNDVYVTLMDVNRIPKGAVDNLEKVVGRQLSRSVVANVPLIENMLIDLSSAKKGRRVTLLIESERFAISTIGELKEDGQVGNYVKAVNLASKKVVNGILIDENTVKVDF